MLILDRKIRVGILGATGIVGQKYLQLLQNHPWFEVTFLAASSSSAGKTYSQAVLGRWHMNSTISQNLAGLTVHMVTDLDQAERLCELVFSAVEMDKKAVQDLELAYAKKGLVVISNSSAHRWSNTVPMLIPEINIDHLDIISAQKKYYGFQKGCLIVKPNCSLQSYITPVYALIEAGFEVEKLLVTTMQAISGAGYPGVASLDIIDNLVPYILGEEEKTEQEPLKILGSVTNNTIQNYTGLTISAHCNRVAVTNGHTACVSLQFGKAKPSISEILSIWQNFRGSACDLDLPSAPSKPIVYMEEENRPQPKKDRDLQKGMAVSVGRLRECNLFDYRFVGLSHNTIRGAAGGGILNAEL